MASNIINPNPIQHRVVVLSNSEVNASYATPIKIISSPGAGKYTQIHEAIIVYKATATTSTTASGASSLDCNGNTVCSQSLASLTNSKAFFKTPNTSADGTYVDQHIYFKTASANPTVYGSVELHLWYTVQDLTQV